MFAELFSIFLLFGIRDDFVHSTFNVVLNDQQQQIRRVFEKQRIIPLQLTPTKRQLCSLLYL